MTRAPAGAHRAAPASRGRRLAWLATLVAAAVVPAAARAGEAGPAAGLALDGAPPADYLLGRLRDHRVVLLGEHHWIRQDAALVRALVPRLAPAGVTTLAMEVLPASEQGRVDRMLAAGSWDGAEAIRVLRAGAWPYRETEEILRAAWESNRALPAGTAPLRVLALGPGPDWRERLLPGGRTYDTFMADRVLEAAREPGRRILVYCGVNHAFTRFEQPELPRESRVERFMQRMGNILRREMGEDVFLVMLHAPWRCRDGPEWRACLPAGGALDCAAAAGTPVAFDVAGAPAGDILAGADAYYSLGSPGLRLAELTDGYIWTAPPSRLEGMGLIPLDEFAPDDAALAEVRVNDPFSDDTGLDRAAIAALWDRRAAELADLPAKLGWSGLAVGAAACATRAAAAPPVLRIYLARHGETEWNRERRLQGRTDVPLDEVGRAQARALAERLARVPLDAIYSSTLARSRETARIVAGERPVESLPQLDEQSVGRFEGVRLDGSDAQRAAEFERRRADPDDTLDGGESQNQHLARVREGLALLRARHASGSILIVGHGGTNVLLLRLLLGLGADDAEGVHQDNTELYLVEVPADGPAILWKQIPPDRLGEL